MNADDTDKDWLTVHGFRGSGFKGSTHKIELATDKDFLVLFQRQLTNFSPYLCSSAFIRVLL